MRNGCNTLEIKLKLKSHSDTNHLAEIISQNLFPGFVLGLTGDLGSGKTTFTKYLAKHMGISDTLNSPTFTILKVYDNDPLDLYHMDVYRLEGGDYDYELEDFIYDHGVSVIEWYQYIEEMLPEEMLKISINVIEEDLREVKISGEGRYEEVVKDIIDRYGY
ncbi:MAG TPA: tRNA (adenosine(37)-N6)-threonylcarbamoyltransferase complex ATPase subunit type 1 TsaE [Bacillota bacterium]|nr:tRNA (adenosine(37)-N6)-threonylcarbamoyltransferase complex ATPase subunit type 1 TsaE [Bacillota bacterium]